MIYDAKATFPMKNGALNALLIGSWCISPSLRLAANYKNLSGHQHNFVDGGLNEILFYRQVLYFSTEDRVRCNEPFALGMKT